MPLQWHIRKNLCLSNVVWISDWKSHGSEYYECSRYKENPNIGNESAHAQAREALKKYLFYFERVGVSREALMKYLFYFERVSCLNMHSKKKDFIMFNM